MLKMSKNDFQNTIFRQKMCFMCTTIETRISISKSPTTYFTQIIPAEIMIIISEYAGASIIHLANSSNRLKNSFEEVTQYFLSRDTPNLRPLDTDDLTTMVLVMNPSLFNRWGLPKSTLAKEIALCDATRRGDVINLNHIMSLGVDVNARTLCVNNDDCYVNGRSLFPVQEAVGFNQINSFDLLLKYGADINPMCNISKRWFIDGPVNLLSSRSEMRFDAGDNGQIIRRIIDEHIRVKDFTIFFMSNNWRSDERLFPYFCDALATIPLGTFSGYCANCDKCNRFCQNVAFFNGRMFCQVCVNDPLEQARSPFNYLVELWIEPAPTEIDYDYDYDSDYEQVPEMILYHQYQF